MTVRVALITVALVLTSCSASGEPGRPEAASESPRPMPQPSVSPSPPSSIDEVPSDTRPVLTMTRKDATYVIDGQTTGAIARQLRRHGPGRSAAHVRYLITYRWAAIERPNDGCKLVAPRVALAYTVLLPKLAASVPPSVASIVVPAIAQLRAHENGHVRIARDTARRTLHVISRMRPRVFRSCPRLDAKASRAASHAVRVGDMRQKAYDIATDHGLDQAFGI